MLPPAQPLHRIALRRHEHAVGIEREGSVAGKKGPVGRGHAEKGVFAVDGHVQRVAGKLHGPLREVRARYGYARSGGIVRLREQGLGAQVENGLTDFVMGVGDHGILEGQGVALVAARVHVRQIIGDEIHPVFGGQRAEQPLYMPACIVLLLGWQPRAVGRRGCRART